MHYTVSSSCQETHYTWILYSGFSLLDARVVFFSSARRENKLGRRVSLNDIAAGKELETSIAIRLHNRWL